MSTKPPIVTDSLTQADFIEAFYIAQRDAYTINSANGWWEDREAIAGSGLTNALPTVATSCLGLVGTEISEAIEAVRKHNPRTWSDAKTPDTLVRELAGAVIRCMDLAQWLELPLAEAIVEEIKRNSERGYKHGGKAV